MKLNRKNTKKRQQNNFPEVRKRQQYTNYNSKNIPQKKYAKIGRIGKPANKKRQMVKIVRRRQFLSKRNKVWILVLGIILVMLLFYIKN